MNKLTVVACVLGSSTAALADTRVALLDPPGAPGATEQAQAAPAPAHLYVSADAIGGADTSVDWMAGGGGITAGYRLSDTLWFRGRIDTIARVGYGTLPGDASLHSPTQAHADALVGVETRRCTSPATCFTVGADAGLRSPDSRYGAGIEVVPRVGLDVGNDHLRFRPSVEAKVAWISGYDTELGGVLPAFGLGVSLGAAYLW